MIAVERMPPRGVPLAVLQGDQCLAWRQLVEFVHVEPERPQDEAAGILARGIAPVWVRRGLVPALVRTSVVVPALVVLAAFGPGLLALWVERPQETP